MTPRHKLDQHLNLIFIGDRRDKIFSFLHSNPESWSKTGNSTSSSVRRWRNRLADELVSNIPEHIATPAVLSTCRCQATSGPERVEATVNSLKVPSGDTTRDGVLHPSNVQRVDIPPATYVQTSSRRMSASGRGSSPPLAFGNPLNGGSVTNSPWVARPYGRLRDKYHRRCNHAQQLKHVNRQIVPDRCL